MKRLVIAVLVVVMWLSFFIGCKKTTDTPLADTPYELQYPDYLPRIVIPADNPLTVNGVALGRRLFYDPIFSQNNTISCASCHKIANGFADNVQFSKGVDVAVGITNASSLVNIAWYNRFFWDGRVTSLEEQVEEPIQNPIEMHETLTNTVQKVQNHPDYPRLFKAAFGSDGVTIERLTKAIAQFERTIISAGNSTFDKFEQTNNPGVFTKDEFEGYKIFFSETGDCFHCHGGALSTTTGFENNGLNENITGTGYGKTVSKSDSDGMFRVPSLRNAVFSAPYMHDGRFNTLEEVIEHYNSGLKDSPTLHPKLKLKVEEGGLNLSESQKNQLLAFLKTYTDTAFINRTDLKKPF